MQNQYVLSKIFKSKHISSNKCEIKAGSLAGTISALLPTRFGTNGKIYFGTWTLFSPHCTMGEASTPEM